MKKKLFFIALMAALSTVGYGAEVTMGDVNQAYSDAVTVGKDDHNKQQAEIDEIKGIVEKLPGEINQAYSDAVTVGKDDHNKQQVEVDSIKGEVDGLKNEVGNLTDFRNETSEAVGKLQNDMISTNEEIDSIKGNVEEVKGQVSDLQEGLGKLESNLDTKVENTKEELQNAINGNTQQIVDLNNSKLDKDTYEKDKLDQEKRDEDQDGKIHNVSQRLENFKDQVNSDNAAQNDNIRDNAAAIEDLKNSKLDKDTYETDKAAQKVTDDNQNSKIEANSQAIEANKNAIAETNKQVETNKNAITSNSNRLDTLENGYAQVNGRLSGLEKKVDNLDNKMNKGLSLMAAMNAVDFQNVQTGEVALGAGIGHYGNAQSVALGVAYSPVENLTVNAKYSVTAGSPDSFAVGAGATYKFKVGR